MPIIESRINTRSQDYTDNARAMQAQLDDLNQQLARTALGGNEAARAKHVARGKLLPRDRVEQLIDPGSPFLELSPMAAHGMYEGEAPGAGVITGIGRVSGTECVIVCNDATVKGGTYPMTVKSTCARRRSPRRTACPASTWSTPAAPICRARTRSSPTATTSAASSTTRPPCRPRASRRSRW